MLETGRRLRRRCKGGCERVLPTFKSTDPHKMITVSWVADPFADEVYDNQTKKWLCQDCYEESAREI